MQVGERKESNPHIGTSVDGTADFHGSSWAAGETTRFGTLDDGTAIDLYSLKNAKGSTAKVISYGASLTELWMPDRSGKLGDVVLGFDNLQGYTGKHPWFGATVGRVANRIANGKFMLDGKEYSLEINDPPNNLHSGSRDLSRVVWQAEPVHERNAEAVRFRYDSPDGDQGFPGNLRVTVLYRLTDSNELQLEYTARTDKATPVNLTNHSYFNLDGDKDILAEVLQLNAEKYTPVDLALIPTGEICAVRETALDFTYPVAIGAHIAEMKGDPGGYDHNFVLGAAPGKLKLAARVFDEGSGRQMEVWTSEPGVQFYSGNFLDGNHHRQTRGRVRKTFWLLSGDATLPGCRESTCVSVDYSAPVFDLQHADHLQVFDPMMRRNPGRWNQRSRVLSEELKTS
jgi:aldose 1-epimerase